MAHYQENPNLNPDQALNHWNSMMSQSNPQQGQQNPNQMQGNAPGNPQMQQQQQQQQQGMPPGMPPGSRTPQTSVQPGLPPNHQFMSPALQNQLLPNGPMNGSPHLMQQTHTPSPASHPMVHQHSQQSNAASVNTSPNVSNKRRRSTAKIEGDDGGGDMNGAPKVKQSPRVGQNKRVKGN